MDVFPEKKKKILYQLANFSKQKMITGEDQTKYWSEKTCHTCEDEFIEDDKIYFKVRDFYFKSTRHYAEASYKCVYDYDESKEYIHFKS